MGRTLYSQLPPVRPYVTAVYPDRFRQDFIPQTIKIQGRYFDSPFATLQFVGLQGIPLVSDAVKTHYKVSRNLIESQLGKHQINQIKQLAPGVHEMELVTDAGQTIWKDAVTIDPVPAPLLTSATAKPVQEFVPAGNLHKKQNLTLIGQNFAVGDASLKVAVGNAVMIPLDDATITDQSISVDLQMKKLGLPPGKYNLLVATSGGQAVLTNAIEIDYKNLTDDDYQLPPVPPLVITVYPNLFRQDNAPAEIHVTGDFFKSPASKVRSVELGGILLDKPIYKDHSLIVALPAHQLAPTNYDLELVNDAGRTVISNALQILPVPAPVITAMSPTSITITNDPAKTDSPAPGVAAGPGATNQPAAAPATAGQPAPPPAKAVPLTQLTLLGQNFMVGDSSLKIAVGGNLFTNLPAATDDKIYSFDFYTNNLKGLKPGQYELAVITSGGRTVLSNAVSIVNKPSPPSPTIATAISEVDPKHGYLFSTTDLNVKGTNFTDKSWSFSGLFGHPPSAVRNVTVGGRSCKYEVVSDTSLHITVPPWSKYEFTNDLAMATNKLDLVVVADSGIVTLTNAVYFDLTLPNDASTSLPLSPEEMQGQKLLHAESYMARVLGTNLVVTPSASLSTSVGAKSDKTASPSATSLPAITATLQIGTNTTTTVGSTNQPAKSP